MWFLFLFLLDLCIEQKSLWWVKFYYRKSERDYIQQFSLWRQWFYQHTKYIFDTQSTPHLVVNYIEDVTVMFFSKNNKHITHQICDIFYRSSLDWYKIKKLILFMANISYKILLFNMILIKRTKILSAVSKIKPY